LEEYHEEKQLWRLKILMWEFKTASTPSKSKPSSTYFAIATNTAEEGKISLSPLTIESQ